MRRRCFGLNIRHATCFKRMRASRHRRAAAAAARVERVKNFGSKRLDEGRAAVRMHAVEEKLQVF